ncbi:MAG: pyridoxal phosphate-dependent aminotransferase [Oscillospiraceae bacterium]|jgi:cystathionine beta-lyase|nr:pyridoxal phosphate-dependent aminotransferase [Oscillospiraceae bacterium]
MTDFDRIINRRGTNSLKHDGMAERGMPEDILPLWVADMDFRSPPKVVEAAERAAAHGVYGYTVTPESLDEAFVRWHRERLGWDIKNEWIIHAPGVMYEVAAAICALTSKGDAVLVQLPVYHCFISAIRLNERRVVSSDLILEDGRYIIDFDDFESKIVSNNVKLFILCNPHNPVARVFTVDELTRMGEICLRHGVTVLSDEIHQDFVYAPYKQIPYASIDPELADSSIICNAPSKTFNLASINVAAMVIPNAELRAKLTRVISANFGCELSPIAVAAVQAAYEHGAQWLDELKAYLLENYAAVKDGFAARSRGIRVQELQATYLAWLDFRSLNISQEELQDRIWNRAKVWLNDGLAFGEPGRGFMRINIASPRSVIKEAVSRISDAFI